MSAYGSVFLCRMFWCMLTSDSRNPNHRNLRNKKQNSVRDILNILKSLVFMSSTRALLIALAVHSRLSQAMLNHQSNYILNEADQDMKNSAEQGGCYPQRPKAEMDNTLRDLQNFSYPTKGEFNNCFMLYSFKIFSRSQRSFPLIKNNTTSSPGFLGQRFNIKSAAGCTFDVILTPLVE